MFLHGMDTKLLFILAINIQGQHHFQRQPDCSKGNNQGPNPHPIMAQYIKSQDILFPFHSQLWLKSNGSTPLSSWFIKCLCHYFSAHITWKSLQVGSATAIAEAGTEPQLIKGAGRWSSSTFKHYIGKDLVILS